MPATSTRGRKPKPTALKLLDNNPGKRALNADESHPLADPDARPPAHLMPEARREWRRMIKILSPLGLYTELDKPALAAYCTAWARHVEAEKNLQKYGMVLVGQGSGAPYLSPYYAVANKAWDQMVRSMAEFGMSPSSRSRVTATTPGDSAGKWDGLLD